jgi:hypothetical protein
VGLGAGPAAIAALNTQLGGDALGTSLSLGICGLAIGTAALGLALGSKLPMVAKSS